MAAEAKPRSNRLFVIVGILLAAAAFAGSFFLSRSNAPGGGGGGATRPVLVAKVEIPKGALVNDTNVGTQDVPVATAPRDALKDVKGLEGFVTKSAISINTPITPALVGTAAQAALAGAGLVIAPGNVALAIPVEAKEDVSRSAQLIAVGFYIQPDDHIDILVDRGDATVRFGFQDVHVLRAGVNAATTVVQPATGGGTTSTPPPSTGANAGVYIVELPRAQAEQLTALLTRPANPTILKYVLRPQGDYGKGYLPTPPKPIPTTEDAGVSVSDLNRLFGGK